ncbi:nitroreductase [Alkaliphilus metalliredigens QYMF]|uniref:Nitroreductase n=1 Tax=Alkaliphilus metalliredigens (strain QYMF) TaxID=293826 RepID=A6TU95_ALKMQ|nr:nitroreductase family protein [Alkaliphilus metalliredigens]ABR49763.1 nitroreductase [Alkaliphilus metalliredigens QYMF]
MKKSVKELIIHRKSTRNFSKKPIEESILNELKKQGQQSKALYEAISVTFEISKGKEITKKLGVTTGYFGKLFEAPHYLVAITDTKEGYQENMGYQMEQVLLAAQELQIGTCWIAVIHHRQQINEFFNVPRGRTLLALSPIGSEVEPFGYKLLNRSKQSEPSIRKSLDEFVWIDSWDRPYNESKHGSLDGFEAILKDAKLAPSWGNEQPWRVLIEGEQLHLYTIPFKKDEESFNPHKIDCGIFMYYIEALAKEVGIESNWSRESVTIVSPKNFQYIATLKLNRD